MIYNDVIFGSVSASDIKLNMNELYARLGTCELNDKINVCIEKVKRAALCRLAYVTVNVRVKDDYSDFGFLKVKSKTLSRVLNNTDRAFFIAVTLGNEVDRLIARASVTSKTEAFYLDAVSSAYAESLMEHVNEVLARKYELNRRISPGYSDFPLEVQEDLLLRLESHSSVGILLTDKKIMVPMKSVTAVIGIKSERSSHI